MLPTLRLPKVGGEQGELAQLSPFDHEQTNRFIMKMKRLLQLPDKDKRRERYPRVEDWCCFRNRGFGLINCFTNVEWAELLGLDHFKTLFLLSCAVMNTTLSPEELQQGMQQFQQQFTPQLLLLRQQQPQLWSWLLRQWWHQQTVDILWHAVAPPDKALLSSLLSLHPLTDPGPVSLRHSSIVVVDAICDRPGASFARDIIGFQMQQFVELMAKPPVMTMKQLRHCNRDEIKDKELVVFGAHTLGENPEQPWVWPANAVLANYECLSQDYGTLLYRFLLRTTRVLDFSLCNRPFLPRHVVFPPCPTPCLLSARAPATDDSNKRVFFLGSVTARRSQWLAEVEKITKLKVNVVFGQSPRRMLQSVPQNAVVLNMRHRDTPHLETVRLLQLVMNGIAVVSEWAEQDAASPVYREAGVCFVKTPQEMAAKTLELLQQARQQCFMTRGQDAIERWSQAILQKTLAEQQKDNKDKKSTE